MAAVLVVVYLLPITGGLAAAAGLLGATVGGAVIVGAVKALRERLREIDGGEEEDASQY